MNYPTVKLVSIDSEIDLKFDEYARRVYPEIMAQKEHSSEHEQLYHKLRMCYRAGYFCKWSEVVS